MIQVKLSLPEELLNPARVTGIPLGDFLNMGKTLLKA
jgi:hypothetical protein